MNAVIALILKNFSLKLDERKRHATKVEIAYERIIYFIYTEIFASNFAV